nr:factor H-binding protein [Neisseria sp. HMSC069H12]
MMRTLRISALTASLSLMLAACGGATSGLSNAVTEPLNPHPKGVLSIELNESVPENGTLELTANGKTQTLKKGGKLDTGFLKTDKVSSYDYAQKIKVKGQVITLETGDFQVYKQNYSTVAARYAKQKADDAGKLQNLDTYTFTVGEVQGDETAYHNLPKQGSYQYSGIAFNGDDRSGRLKYTVDFDKKQGYGKISSMASHNNVDLLAAGIANNNGKAAISGKTSLNGVENGRYDLKLFGPQAEEIAGKAQIKVGDSTKEIGLAGKKE